MAKIVIGEFMDAAAVEYLAASHEVIYDPALVDDTTSLLKALDGAAAIIVRNRTQVNEAMLNAGKDLRVVGRLGVGLDNIDLDLCAARGVAVCPARGANDISVAEYVITAALILLRRAWLCAAEMVAGEWPRNQLIGQEISGKQMGLVGYGSIARETANRALALGMAVSACDPYLPPEDPAWAGVRRLDLEPLLLESDVVSLHVPLTDDTRHMINAATLKSLRPGAILINAARGGIIDETALVAALRSGRLGGAALDVFAEEPLGAERGALFRDVPNLLLTPHIGGVTVESNVRVSRVTADNVLKYL